MSTDAPGPERRGTRARPPNRFGGPVRSFDGEHVENDLDYLESLTDVATEYIPDRARSVVSENESPDLGFRFSVNPYRGCLHGCAYCYARPTHEYLGFDSGVDFETKILVKEDAPALFESHLADPKWQPELIALSGVTDPYQPIEYKKRLTRGCIEVASEFGQPLTIVTKNALVARDVDLLAEMAQRRLIHVNVSITTLDNELCRSLEPRTSLPDARLRAITRLSTAGVPVRVLVAPIIPGVNDAEIPEILARAADAGAGHAGYTVLRLPRSVVDVFFEWVDRTRPDARSKIESRIRELRGGDLNDSRFGRRMRGEGELAEQIRALFRLFRKRCGLDQPLEPVSTTSFRRPRDASGQGLLF